MKKSLAPLLIAPMLLLAACSPHPGAGQWQSAQQGVGEIARMNVSYEGRANMFSWQSDPAADADETAMRRCFWHGTGPQSIEMTCVLAANTDIEEKYLLQVSAERMSAELLQDGRVVAQFVRNR